MALRWLVAIVALYVAAGFLRDAWRGPARTKVSGTPVADDR
jgi:hypothetical protein